jgi:hypothetical protein
MKQTTKEMMLRYAMIYPMSMQLQTVYARKWSLVQVHMSCA